jgi:glycosyltransferase involved in cell wall biosynthesis
VGDGRSDPPRAVVAVNQDASTHRRSREVVAALRHIGIEVTLVSPGPGLDGDLAGVRHRRIGAGGVPRLLGRSFGTISRNLARLAITVLTLLPEAVALWALDRSTRIILRLDALVEELQDRPDIVLVEDVLLLPAVVGRRGESRVIFDAREFFPLQFEHSFIWRVLIGSGMHRLMRMLLPECDAVTTVSEGLRDGYRGLCGVEPHVILNVPRRGSCGRGRSELRALQDAPLRIVFHGRANRNRRIEVFASAGVLLARRATIDIYLTGPRRRRRAIAGSASDVSNVRVHEPLRFGQIPTTLARYDLAAIFYPPSTFNLLHSMPSKFFEYLHSGLPVVIGPYPDMARIVRTYDCGIVAEDFTPQALAAAIDSVSPERLVVLQANARSAADELCAEVEYRKLTDVVMHLLGTGRSRP